MASFTLMKMVDGFTWRPGTDKKTNCCSISMILACSFLKSGQPLPSSCWTRNSYSAWFGNHLSFKSNRWKLREQLWRSLYDKRATGGTEGLFSVDLVGVHHPQPQRFTHQTWALRQSISPKGFSVFSFQSVSLLWAQLFLPRKLMTDDADADDRFLLKFNDDKVVFLFSPVPFLSVGPWRQTWNL